MNEDNKTVTMSLSEYRRMEEIVASYNAKLFKDLSNEVSRLRYVLNIKQIEINDLKHENKNIKDKLSSEEDIRKTLEQKITNLSQENNSLEAKILKLKEKKKWQFWK